MKSPIFFCLSSVSALPHFLKPVMWTSVHQFIDFAVLGAFTRSTRIMLNTRVALFQWTSGILVKTCLGLGSACLVYCLLAVCEPHSRVVEFLIGETGKVILAIGISFCVTSYLNYYCRRSFNSARVDPAGKVVLVTGCDSGFGYVSAASQSVNQSVSQPKKQTDRRTDR